MLIQTLYLTPVFNQKMFPRTVRKTVTTARKLQAKYKFDTIAFCGISGAAIAFLLSHRLKLPLLCVRKRNETSHYREQRRYTLLEGNIDCDKYLIVDDFIATGDTVNHIINSISKELPRAKCVSMLMYAAYADSSYCHETWAPFESINVVSSRPSDD